MNECKVYESFPEKFPSYPPTSRRLLFSLLSKNPPLPLERELKQKLRVIKGNQLHTTYQSIKHPKDWIYINIFRPEMDALERRRRREEEEEEAQRRSRSSNSNSFCAGSNDCGGSNCDGDGAIAVFLIAAIAIYVYFVSLNTKKEFKFRILFAHLPCFFIFIAFLVGNFWGCCAVTSYSKEWTSSTLQLFIANLLYIIQYFHED